MQTLSLVWGILSIIGMFVAFFPCLGSLNWINIPFSGVGLIISIIALARKKEEKKVGLNCRYSMLRHSNPVWNNSLSCWWGIIVT
jgi:hypothetical protein